MNRDYHRFTAHACNGTWALVFGHAGAKVRVFATS